MSEMINLIKRLSPLRMAPNSHGLNECVNILCQYLDFKVHEFPAGTECNGWVVPNQWEVKCAEIYELNGPQIYDGLHHPLAVIGYSQTYQGEINGHELKKHLYYSGVFDDALIYHCDLFYKPHLQDWGFSVTKHFFDSIDEQKIYCINLQTEFSDGTMKVAEYVLAGESPESIVINAHNCHPFCCNDDLSGVAVGMEIIKALQNEKNRHYTYRLIIAPEHFGSIFYLNSLNDNDAKNLKSGFFLESVGAGKDLVIQRSFQGNTYIDDALTNALYSKTKSYRTEPFRKVIGNDETCWEGAGFDIPFPSISRCYGDTKFPEYHTSFDSPDLMNEEMLNETLEVCLEAIFIIENNAFMSRNFKGLVSLSNPKYDLYFPMTDPSKHDKDEIEPMGLRWNYLMDCLPRYFDEKTNILQIAKKHKLYFRDVYNYIRKFEQKELTSLMHQSLSKYEGCDIPPF